MVPLIRGLFINNMLTIAVRQIKQLGKQKQENSKCSMIWPYGSLGIAYFLRLLRSGPQTMNKQYVKEWRAYVRACVQGDQAKIDYYMRLWAKRAAVAND